MRMRVLIEGSRVVAERVMAKVGGRGGETEKVKNIVNDHEFQKELVAAEERLVVVNFSASWSAPCKLIAPAFKRLSGQYSSAVFLTVDIDACRSTARKYEVDSAPVFLFFRNREKIKESQVRGADEGALTSAIIRQLDKDSVAPESSDMEEVRTTITVPGQINLSSLVDHNGSECLNESDDHPFAHCLKPDSSYLESDCDQQLIIDLAFMQAVKLHTMQIIAPADGRAPKTIKLFINQPQTLDFDTAEQSKPLQELSLTEDDVLEDSKISLNFVKYQNVQKLTVFVRDNQGDKETTVIQYLGLFGTPRDTTNMSDFKRVTGERGERHN